MPPHPDRVRRAYPRTVPSIPKDGYTPEQVSLIKSLLEVAEDALVYKGRYVAAKHGDYAVVNQVRVSLGMKSHPVTYPTIGSE